MPPKYGRIPGWRADREELAWAAGFCDGEGSFQIDLKGFRNGIRRKPHPRFELGQTEPHILERFRTAVGFANPVGGPYDNTKSDAKRNAAPMYQVGVSGYEGVQMVLIVLWPWLGLTKRKQAINVLKKAQEGHWDSEARLKRVAGS